MRMVGPEGLEPESGGLTVAGSLCLWLGKVKTEKFFSGGPISRLPRPTSDRTYVCTPVGILRIILSKIEEAQRVVSLWRPNRNRTDDSGGVCGPGRARRAGRRGVGSRAGFHRAVRGWNLKTWKTEKLTSRPATGGTRISVFHSPTDARSSSDAVKAERR